MPSLADFSENMSKIVSFYDFDRDRFVDLLVENIQTHEIAIYLWKEDAGRFEQAGKMSIQSDFIESTIVTNLDADHELEIIIMKEISTV